MMKWARDKVKGIWGGVVAAVAVVVAFCSEGVMAAESVTIPAMPVDFADIADKGATVLGTVVAGVIGIFVIVALINMGIKWVKRAFTS